MTGRYRVDLDHQADFDGWRRGARTLDRLGIEPGDIVWQVAGAPSELFHDEARSLPACPEDLSGRTVPPAFMRLAEHVVCHSADDRFGLAYRLLRRLAATPSLLSRKTDPDIDRAESYAKAVRRDSHKMKAFVRFREHRDHDGAPRFTAWFEPKHHVVDMTAGFFRRRFADQRWSILTPSRCAHWDGSTLIVTEGADRSALPDEDASEELWRTYFASIFNPARLNVKAMTAEMPKHYWSNLPEARLIGPLVREAGARMGAMIATPASAPARSTRIGRVRREEEETVAKMLDDGIETLDDLRRAASRCTRCDLHRHATQVVVGEGDPGAPLMFVGEQPGDREDIAGRPFVGPAGQLFDRALAEAGIARKDTFVTNAVKHFKFEPRGKRRIHKSPNATEIDHCRWWLDLERSIVRPRVIVALGASAARALFRRPQTVSKSRGRLLALPGGPPSVITVHPSYLLRLRSDDAKAGEYNRFIADLAFAADAVNNVGAAGSHGPATDASSRLL